MSNYRPKSSYVSKDPCKRANSLLNLRKRNAGEIVRSRDLIKEFRFNRQLFRLKERVLPNGKLYGDVFNDWQETLYKALYENKYLYYELPRGHDKTSMLAWYCLECLLFGEDNQEIFYFACDLEQLEVVIRTIEGFIRRNPRLQKKVRILKNEIINPLTNSRIKLWSSDANSSYGIQPTKLIVEELHAWQKDELWNSVYTSTGKNPDCQVLCVSNAGFDYSSICWKVREMARTNPNWYFYSAPGTIASWISKEWIEMQRATLHPSVFARLIDNKWTAKEGNFITMLDYERILDTNLTYKLKGGEYNYYLALDLGLKHDKTALSIVHKEGDIVILDVMRTWQGNKNNEVEINDVEEAITEYCKTFNVVKIVCDPWQLKSTAQKLSGLGFPIQEFTFSSGSLNKLSNNLYYLIRAGKLKVYPDEALKDELLTMVLEQTSYGVRLDHESGKFSDMVISLGMACLEAVNEEGGLTAEMIRECVEMNEDMPDRISQEEGVFETDGMKYE